MRLWLLLLCISSLNQLQASAKTDANDVIALNVLFTSLNSAGQLKGWTSNNGDPCGQSWVGISCSGSSVTAIKLSGMGLSGLLAYNMNLMNSLITLDMSYNNLGGNSAIPYNLPTNLQTLNLANNQFGGMLPYSISQMGSLSTLNVAHNQLQGNLIDMFSGLMSLTTLDLSFNSLSGALPESFSDLTSLSTLNLQNNQFSGDINVLADLPLHNLNVGNNRFTGWIPNSLKKINSLQTGGNSWNTGPAPPPPPYTAPPPPRRASPRSGGESGHSSDSNGSGGGSGIGGGAIAGIIISILVVAAVAAFFVVVRRRSNRSSQEELFEQHEAFASFPDEAKARQVKESTLIDLAALPPPVSLKAPARTERNWSFEGHGISSNQAMKKPGKSPSIKATVYSVADLQVATSYFNVGNLIGEGSFGRVYRAQFDDGKVFAVMKLSSAVLRGQSSDDFAMFVSNISKLRHPNLSELVGYCMEHGQHLLVYEHQSYGSLHDCLHFPDEYGKPLSWNSRIKVALGSARALEYLHEVCAPSIVHKNFKSSNVLLDSELNPHLSDAGLSCLIHDDEFLALDQGSGYSAPEVEMSGKYGLKSDVYSFGVVMLELLTGHKPFDSSRPRAEQSLVRWATPQLHDIDALDRMVDPALKGLYPAKSLSRFADVIALCVQPEPEFRPPMSEVVQALVRLVQRANMTRRMLDGEDSGAPQRADDPDMQDFM